MNGQVGLEPAAIDDGRSAAAPEQSAAVRIADPTDRVVRPPAVGRARSAAGSLGRSAVGRLAAALPFLVALAVYAGAYLVMRPTPTGDEPHYILYSHSLVFDGDADLRNNYERHRIKQYFPYYEQLDPHAREYLGDGTLHSIHYLGLPVLIAPIVAAGGGVGAVRALMVVLAALLAQQLFGLLRQSGLGSRSLVWLAWIATALSLPLVLFSGQIYPELPGALLVAASLRALARPLPAPRALALVALAAAVLPWLHFRFVILLGGLVAGVAFHLLRGEVHGSVRELPERLTRPAFWRSCWPLALPLVSLVGLGAVTYRLYGSPWPPAMYVPELESIAPWSLAIAYRHGLGAILSPADGWLPFAPIHWLGLAGIVPLLAAFPRTVAPALLVVGAYFVLVAGPVWVGHSLPARYLMPIIPLVAVPLLAAIAISRPARLAFVPLLGLSLVLAWTGVQHHTLLYPDGTGAPALPIAKQLAQVWPDFAADARQATDTGRLMFGLQPTTARRQTGRVVDGPAGPVTHAGPGTDAAGMLAYGPYRPLAPGTYLARFHLAVQGGDPNKAAATVDVMTDLPALFTILARRDVRPADLPSGGGYATIELPFTVVEPGRIETRVRYHGEAELWLGSVDVFQTATQDSVDRDFPSWPRSVLWIAASLFVGALLPSLRPPASARRGR